ncbi:MAG: hypothetical protein PHP31_03600 [Lentimicrobiaceae bacterium]|nr:hypothetical protein [Lentimicrobiaceae bacterium]
MKNKFTLLITLAFLLLFGYSSKAQSFCVIEVKQPSKLQAVIQDVTKTVCYGTTETFTITLKGGTQPWQLTIGTDVISGIYDTDADPNDSTFVYTYTTPALISNTTYSSGSGAGIVTVSVTDKNSCTGYVSGSAAYTVVPEITIAAIPDQTICTGSSTTITAVAGGGTGTFTYQWKVETEPGVWGNATGASATNATYTTPTLTETTKYKVVVTSGGCTKESNEVTITVTPAITIPTIADQTICTGSSTTITAAPTGGNGSYTYQWMVETGPGVWGNATGPSATNATYTTPTLTETTKYKVVVTSGGCTKESNEVTITVTPAISIPTIADQTICTGSSTTITAAPTGGSGSYTYQWMVYDNETSSWGNAPGASATTNEYTTPALTANTKYKVVVTSGGCTKESNEVTITVTPAITIPTIANQTICPGTSTTITAAPTGGNGPGTYSYQWKVETGPGVWGDAPGASATSATYTTPELTSETKYKVVVTSGGCTKESNEVTIGVYTAVIVQNIDNQTICSGNSTILTATLSSGTASSYQWKEKVGGSWQNATGGSGATTASYTTPTLAENMIYKVIVTSSDGCVGESNEVTITVTPTLTLPDIANQTICTGTGTTLTANPDGGNGSYDYQWKKYNAGTMSWDNVGTNSNTYATGNLTATTQYKVVVTSGACTKESNEITVTVLGNITITTQPASTTVCSGVQATLSVTASGSVGHTLNYQWQKYDGSDWQNVGTNHYEYETTAETPAAGTTSATTYRVIVTYAELPTCKPATSNDAIVTTSGGPTSQYTLTNATCYGGTGSIVIKVTAGVPNFTVTLYEGEGLGGTVVGTQTVNAVNGTATFTPLPAMKYTVTVKDQYGCEGTCPTEP